MAFYLDEEEVWKCPKHPSKHHRRRSGICPSCLRDRLGSLCPDCANVRPCNCSTSSSSSSSSSFSRSRSVVSGAGAEPEFSRSRSVAVSFLRSRSRFGVGDGKAPVDDGGDRRKSPSVWSIFKLRKGKRDDDFDEDLKKTMMMRSKSVGIPPAIGISGGGDDRRTSAKGRGWYFPSPMKAFRQSKASKVVQELLVEI